MGYSTGSYYRIKELHDTKGQLALDEISLKKAITKNQLESDIDMTIVELAYENLALRRVKIAKELKKNLIFVSSSGVRCLWLRHDQQTVQKGFKHLEPKLSKKDLF